MITERECRGMKYRNCPTLCTVLGFLLSIVNLHAQEQTVGLFLNEEESFHGYTLFAPIPYTSTYLIDNSGRLIHEWEGESRPGQSVYLMENGHLLRTAKVSNQNRFTAGGTGGRVQELTWDGDLVWDFIYSDTLHCQHHDIEPMPNGNVLLIVWEYKSAAEVIEAGRDPDLLVDGELWPDSIIEVEPTGSNDGKVVWEWHLWDHLIQDFDSTKANYGVVADHPELLDINFVAPRGMAHDGADWNHTNSIDYNAEMDQIMISAHAQSEIYIIDHSTTTEEAASHTGGRSGKGGDILYRWGNPQGYRTGTGNDQRLFRQHDASWIESGLPGEGHLLVFNNGRNRPDGNYSSIDEIIPPVDEAGNYARIPGTPWGPSEPTWTYMAPDKFNFFSQNNSGTHRLDNGNTLICSGTNGRFFEVTPDKEMVWEYINPVTANGPVFQGDPVIVGVNLAKHLNSVFTITRYSSTYPGLTDKDLTPGDPIEIYPSAIEGAEDNQPGGFRLFQNTPNPFNASTVIRFQLSDDHKVILSIMNTRGQTVRTLVNNERAPGKYSVTWNGRDQFGRKVVTGIYIYKLEIGGKGESMKMILIQ